MVIGKEQLLDFESFALERIAAGIPVESWEELLDAYRFDRSSSVEREADVVAVRASLNDMARGEQGRSIAEFDAEFCQRNRVVPVE